MSTTSKVTLWAFPLALRCSKRPNRRLCIPSRLYASKSLFDAARSAACAAGLLKESEMPRKAPIVQQQLQEEDELAVFQLLSSAIREANNLGAYS